MYSTSWTKLYYTELWQTCNYGTGTELNTWTRVGMEASTGAENESNINTKTETSFVVWIRIVIFLFYIIVSTINV
jgi:hypothetical protein